MATKKSVGLTADQVQARLGLKHPRSVYDLSSRGRIARHADNTRKVPLFDSKSVDAYQAQRDAGKKGQE